MEYSPDTQLRKPVKKKERHKLKKPNSPSIGRWLKLIRYKTENEDSNDDSNDDSNYG